MRTPAWAVAPLPLPPLPPLPPPPRCCATPGITADRLSLWWPGGAPALRDVSFHVPRGALAMVAGANGSGKSTLLAALRGLRLPDLGRVSVGAPCAFLPQDAARQLLFPNVGTNVAISLPEVRRSHPEHWRMSQAVVRAMVESLLAEVGFADPAEWVARRARDLSGGEKQRVCVATALAMRPEVLLFDEITASMDPANKGLLLQIVPQIVADRNIAALWVTHTREELEVADMIILLKKGVVVDVGPPHEILPLIDSQNKQSTYFSGVADYA